MTKIVLFFINNMKLSVQDIIENAVRERYENLRTKALLYIQFLHKYVSKCV